MSKYLNGPPTIAAERAQAAARRRPPRVQTARRQARQLTALTSVAMLKDAARRDQPIPKLGGPEFRTLATICTDAARAGLPVFYVGASGLLRVTVDNLTSRYNRAVRIGPGTDDEDLEEDL